MTPDIEERFWARVQMGAPDECWNWTGATDRGYGYVTVKGFRAPLKAHRMAYEFSVGPIPAGMQIDHVCFNRSCVNPAHLRVVTNKQNNEHKRDLQKNNTSGYRGVARAGNSGWRAYVMHNGKFRSKRFGSAEEAAVAAAAMRAELFTHDDACPRRTR